MAGKRAATAAIRGRIECRLWAVHVSEGSPLMRKCCDRSNGGKEPAVTDAALITNDGFTKCEWSG